MFLKVIEIRWKEPNLYLINWKFWRCFTYLSCFCTIDQKIKKNITLCFNIEINITNYLFYGTVDSQGISSTCDGLTSNHVECKIHWYRNIQDRPFSDQTQRQWQSEAERNEVKESWANLVIMIRGLRALSNG